MNWLDYWKKPKNVKPLPNYPELDYRNFTDVPKGSIALFYGGVKLTERVGSRLYKHPYNPPAFHAADYIENGLLLNVGAFRTIAPIWKEYLSTRRIDIISVRDITKEQRDILVKTAYEDSSTLNKPLAVSDYGWWDFLRFGVPFMKPSKKRFCSENVVLHFAKAGIKVSDLKPEDTAPWDLYEYALAHPERFEIYTLWNGKDFRF